MNASKIDLKGVPVAFYSRGKGVVAKHCFLRDFPNGIGKGFSVENEPYGTYGTFVVFLPQSTIFLLSSVEVLWQNLQLLQLIAGMVQLMH
jgi:hypothetical protein